MRRQVPFIIRLSITLVTVIIALLVIFFMFRHYILYPWTRDAQLQAKVVQITSRVSGYITELPIKDNQFIQQGQLLWKLDPRTFEAEVDSQQAALENAIAAEQSAMDLATRVRALVKLDSQALSEWHKIKVINKERQAIATTKEARANLHNAKINLKYTVMYAPVSGYITNLKVYNGSYLTANQPALALVNYKSFWVQAFFKETLIGKIRPGDDAIIKLMAHPDESLKGIVDSVGWGISQQDGSTGVDLLPNIDPSFDWIRLAQRVPVRIHLTHIPHGINLRVGMTATVIILPKH